MSTPTDSSSTSTDPNAAVAERVVGGASPMPSEDATNGRASTLGPAAAASDSTNGAPTPAAASTIAEPPANPVRADAARTTFGLRVSDRHVIAVLAVIGTALTAIHWARLTQWGTTPVEIERLVPRPLDYRIDVNAAPWVEIVQLDGIGPKLAERIIAEREIEPFRSLEDLKRVKGIGDKKIEALRPWVTFGPPPEDATERP